MPCKGGKQRQRGNTVLQGSICNGTRRLCVCAVCVRLCVGVHVSQGLWKEPSLLHTVLKPTGKQTRRVLWDVASDNARKTGPQPKSDVSSIEVATPTLTALYPYCTLDPRDPNPAAGGQRPRHRRSGTSGLEARDRDP